MSQMHHEATIFDITGNNITLELVKTDACNSCAIKNVCQQKKFFLIKVANPQKYTRGKKVNIFIEEKQAIAAIFFGYVLPLIFVLMALFMVLYFTNNEVFAAIFSLIVFPLYYLGIYYFNKKLQKVLAVRIEQH